MEAAVNLLKKHFGYENFRVGQKSIIENILNKRDTFGVMPTGAGKSICFQIPALIFNGITLVISPLISLMKDQVNALSQAGIRAAYINSSLTQSQYFRVMEHARNNVYKIIYIAPERLLSEDFLAFAKNSDISMITVDEAHCISQWGQDFRPSYLKIMDFIKILGQRPVISAFTATATEIVKNDIISSMELENPFVLVTGFDRSNLYFEVRKPKNKTGELFSYLNDKKDRSGIIYCITRKTVEEVTDVLNHNGYNATRYHAGLSDSERKENQEDFIFDRKNIMVATNAFGMGIDKSNVSFVIHYNMPKDMESYYQEAGRAGRDGEPADCILLYNGSDVIKNQFLIKNNRDVEKISQNDFITEDIIARDMQRLSLINLYCQITSCLRDYILSYFGEEKNKDANCQNCGNCNDTYELTDITLPSQKILSCISRVKERYGVKTIADILRGADSKYIKENNLSTLSTHGIMSESAEYIRQVIMYLIENEYIYQTASEYPVLKLSDKAHDILFKREQIFMKIRFSDDNDDEPAYEKRKKSKKSSDRGNTVQVNKNLFDILKRIRKDLADKQNVPAFLVFNDSSLTDMCMKVPRNYREFLDISGVGNKKAEQYASFFTDAINEFLINNPNSMVKNDNSRPIDEATLKTMLLENAVSEESVTISKLCDSINALLLQQNLKKTKATLVADFLIENGYLEIGKDKYGDNKKMPTQTGRQAGIKEELSVSEKGTEYYINRYDTNAQKLVIEISAGLFMKE